MRRYKIRYVVCELDNEVIYCRGRMKKSNTRPHISYVGSTDGVNWRKMWFNPTYQLIFKTFADLVAYRMKSGRTLILPDDMSW